MRDRLIELINRAKQLYKEDMAFDTIDGAKMPTETDYIVDYLLAKGVVCPPCKVGDDIYVPNITRDKVYKTKAVGFIHDVITSPYNSISFDEVFLTKEEAEKYLRGGVQE